MNPSLIKHGTEEYSCLSNISKIESFFLSERPIYKDEMSVETMKNAIDYNFRIVQNFCPDYGRWFEDYGRDIYGFYRKLFVRSPLETVLRTLARVSFEAKEKKLMEHHNVANTLLDRIATTLNLQYKDIVNMTSPASHLVDFPHQQADRSTNSCKLCLTLE